MFSIILPTYNEKDSIKTTINNIKKAIKSSENYEIIVVDDNSPDKTWKIVQNLSKKDSTIKYIRRMNKRGLSSAIIDGFLQAEGEYLFVTDADGQHDETKFDEMLSKLKQNDLVIGTRYKKGGSVEGWSKYRIFVSRFAAMLSKPFLSNKITDPMSGFFGIKKTVFQKYASKLDGRGYKILLDILFQSNKFKIEEVPYHFKTRKAGQSKLSSKVIFDYLLMLLNQAYKTHKHFIPFSIVGLSGVFVNTGILYGLTEFLGIHYLYSSIIAIEISIITNFLLNNFWTWSHRKLKTTFLSRLFKFNLVSLISLTVNFTTLFLLTQYLGLWYVYSNLIGIFAALFINYFVNDRWTFKEQ